jgi:hypothetical protein
MGEHPVKSFKKLLAAVVIGAAMSVTMVAAPAQAAARTSVVYGSTEVKCRLNLTVEHTRIVNSGFKVQSVSPCRKYRDGWEGAVTYQTLRP